MKKLIKNISIFVAVAIIATILPTRILAEGNSNNSSKVETSAAKQSKKEPKIIGEVESKRSINTKQFLMDDMSYEMAIYPEPVHYLSNGKWEDIDNSLSEQEDKSEVSIIDEKAADSNALDVADSSVTTDSNKKEVDNNSITKQEAKKAPVKSKVFANKKNDFNINISKKSNSKNLVSIKKDKYEVNWSLEGTNTVDGVIDPIDISKVEKDIENSVDNALSKDNDKNNKDEKRKTKIENEKKKLLPNASSEVLFKGIFNNIDLQYNTTGNKVKENIIINNPSERTEFVFDLDAKNLVPEVQKDKSIIFYDDSKKKNPVFSVNAPFMFDAKNNCSDSIDVKVDKDKKGYKMTLSLDKEWLNSADRVYPITVDPTVITSTNIKDITDTFVSSNDSSNKWQNQYLRVGSIPSIGMTRSFIRFTTPSDITSATTIRNAQLYLYLSGAGGNCQVDVHRLTQDVAFYGLTWSNSQGIYNSKVEDYINVSSSSAYNQYMDITSMVKEWTSTGKNYGLMIKDHYESTANATFLSSDWGDQYSGVRPCVLINYVNNSGLEDYWTYHSQPIGRGGTGYINDYNGNLIYVHDDLTMNGSRMPISIKHVYNSNDRSTDIGYGLGWRLNLSQRIAEKYIGGTRYYEYIDEDGTKHYFSIQDGVWKDEASLGYTLTLNADRTFTITDKKNNKLIFTEWGYLWKIIDSNNNLQTLSYNGGTLISVTDGAGRVVKLNVLSNNQLVGITDPSGRTINFGYNGVQLSRITYPDNNVSTYTYDSNNNMTTAKNYDGYTITYSYYDTLPYRVKKATESNGSTLGQELNINYGFNTTTFTDVKGRKDIYQFNNSGNTISVKNDDGSASYYKYDDISNTNKLTTSSKLQKVTGNYLKNHNLELDSYWSFANDSPSTASGQFNATEKYLGQRSIMISKTNGPSRSYYQQTLTLEKGKTYTYSGYIKTSGISNNNGQGAHLLVHYKNNSGVWCDAYSSYASGTNDWSRYEVTFTIPSDASSADVIVRTAIATETGTAYFDCLQLEDGSIANRYNLVENSDFNFDTGVPLFWTRNSAGDSNDTQVNIDGKSAFRFNGVGTLSKNLSQTIQVSGNTNDVFVLSGWAKGQSVPLSSGRYFALDVGFSDMNGNINQWEVLQFNEDTTDWQYASTRLIAKYPYKSVTIYALYYNNANTAYFDNLQLYKEEFGESYQYDSKGNIVSTKNLASQNSKFDYNGTNDLVTSTDPKGNQFKYEYDSNHNIKTATSAENVVYSFEYDSFGNPKKSKIGDSSLFIEANAAYTSSGNYLSSMTDAFGNTTTYKYDETKDTLTSVVDPKDNPIDYEYDTINRLTGVTKVVDYEYRLFDGQKQEGSGTFVTNKYGYENDRIKTITQNRFSYNFNYDSLGNNTSVSVGSQNLINNSYESRTSKLLESTYGNGQKVSNDYDNLDRITAKKYNGNIRYKYQYDASGNLGYHEDLVNGVSYRSIYDVSNRLTKVVDSNGNTLSYDYDLNNNNSKIIDKVNGNTYITNYSYNNDNKPNSITYSRDSSNTLNYSYDIILGRLKSSALNTGSTSFTTTYNYIPGVSGSTTNKIGSINNNGGIISYTYDVSGNIETVIDAKGKKIKYYYNELNELIREDNEVLNKTITYKYNEGGNIIIKQEYNYTTGTLDSAIKIYSHSYEDTNWKDKLTSYDGKAITYDAIGNPLTYNGYTYTWEEGRQLSSISGNGLTASYKYNDAGIRTQKSINGVVTNYHLVGDKVTYETNGTDKIYYTYDCLDNLVSMNLNGVEYYYIRNAQGDIIGLFDKTGTQVVSYTYDTWGKLISIDGSLKDSVGVKNPYRYRGYRYDTETGLYYLNSRYYNPEWGRFINADGIIGQTGELLGHNLFVYSKNNPVNMSDPNGFRPIYTIGEETQEMMEASVQTMKKAAMIQNSSYSAKPSSLYRRVKGAITKNNGTTTIGVSEEHAIFAAGGLSVGISFDYKGNVALQFTPSFGAGSPNISAGIYYTKTNAPDVMSLTGIGHAVGGSIGDGVYVGGDFLVIPNSKGGNYYGTTVNTGLGARMPLPGEMHYLPGYTITLYQDNIFDRLESLFNLQ